MFLLALVVLAVMAAVFNFGAKAFRPGPAHAANLPPAFAEHLSLAQAQTRAADARPVLAFATADWCAPCRQFKRTTLQDERVTAWILENTVPAYVEIDQDPAGAQLLSVTSIPAVVLLHAGKPVAKFEGLIDADRFLAWGADALARDVTPNR